MPIGHFQDECPYDPCISQSMKQCFINSLLLNNRQQAKPILAFSLCVVIMRQTYTNILPLMDIFIRYLKLGMAS